MVVAPTTEEMTMRGKFGKNLLNGLIGAGGGAAGITLFNFIASKAVPATVSTNVVSGIGAGLGLLGGAAIANKFPALGCGIAAAMLGSVIASYVSGVMPGGAPGVQGLAGGYSYSNRYGMHGQGRHYGMGQLSPHAFAVHGLGQTKPGYYDWGMGRTRVVELFPGAYQTA